MTPAERCAVLLRLDREYRTEPGSPLHHDNRHCPVHGDGHAQRVRTAVTT